MKYFNIKYVSQYDFSLSENVMISESKDIKKLCQYYLENNLDLDYYNKFSRANTISKRIYQYAA